MSRQSNWQTSLLLSILLVAAPPVYATVTISNSNIEMTDSNLNITSAVTMESLKIEEDGITAKPVGADMLRKYTFYNSTSPYNVQWVLINSTEAMFNVTSAITDAEGNVTGTMLGDVKLDGTSVSWTYTTLNTVDIGSADVVEYIFPVEVVFNTIILSLNTPIEDRLGGVYSASCDIANNFTMIGVSTAGTPVCAQLSDFGGGGSGELVATSYNDASRPTCNGAATGTIIFNTDDSNLNICDGSNWRLPDGSVT